MCLERNPPHHDVELMMESALLGPGCAAHEGFLQPQHHCRPLHPQSRRLGLKLVDLCLNVTNLLRGNTELVQANASNVTSCYQETWRLSTSVVVVADGVQQQLNPMELQLQE